MQDGAPPEDRDPAFSFGLAAKHGNRGFVAGSALEGYATQSLLL
jgi:hypothetical protein